MLEKLQTVELQNGSYSYCGWECFQAVSPVVATTLTLMLFLMTCMQGHVAMGIEVTQWRVEIARYVKFAGRTRHGRGKSPGVRAASATSCSPLLALLLSFCLITAPSLLLQAGDVERNPGPPKIQRECGSRE